MMDDGLSSNKTTFRGKMDSPNIPKPSTISRSVHSQRTSLNDIILTLFKYNTENCPADIKRFVCSLIELMADVPEIFLLVPTSDETANVSQELLTEFNRWLLGRVLCWLGKREYAICHATCLQFLSSFLQLLKLHNLLSYVALSSDLIHLSPKLLDASKVLDTGGSDVEIHASPPPQNLHDTMGLDLTSVPIILRNFEACEILQTSLLQLLKDSVVPNLFFLLPCHVESLCTDLCNVLQLSSLSLKHISLELISEVIAKNGGQPYNDRFFRTWLFCLANLFSVSCSPDSSKYPRNEELQTALAENMKFAVAKSLKRFESAECAFTFVQFQKLIYKVLSESGLVGIKSPRLLEVVENMMKYTLKNGFKPATVESISIANSVVDGLLNNVGKMVSSELMVHCLCLQVELEIEQWRLSENKKRECDNLAKKPKLVRTPSKLSFPSTSRSLFAGELPVVSVAPLSCQISATWNKLLPILNRSLNPDFTQFSRAADCLTQMRVACEIFEIGLVSQVHLPNDIRDESSDPVQLLPGNVFSRLRSVWNSVLKFSANWTQLEMKSLAKIILRIIAAVVYASDSILTSKDILNDACFVASLPWCRDSEKCRADLEIQDNGNLSRISAYMNDDDTINSCWDILANLPSYVCPIWRITLFQEILVSGDKSQKLKALKSLPFIVNILNEHSCCQIFPLLRSVVTSTDESFICALCGEMGNIFLASSALLAVSRLPYSWTGTLLNAVKIDGSVLRLANEETRRKMGERLNAESVRELFCHFIESSSANVRTRIVPHLQYNFFCEEQNEHFLRCCLKFLGDDDYAVRLAFSEHIGGLMPKIEEGGMVSVLVEGLKKVIENAKEKESLDLQDTLMRTAGQIAKWSDGDVLLDFTLILVEHLAAPTVVSASAHYALKEMFASKALKAKEFFMKHLKPICRVIACSAHDAVERKAKYPLQIFTQISATFNFDDEETCIQACLEIVLPYLVCKCTPHAKILIKSLSFKINVPYRKLISDYYDHIFVGIVCGSVLSEQQAVFDFIKEITGISWSSLLKCHVCEVQNELLLHLGTHYEKVFQGITLIIASQTSQSSGKDILSAEKMANYLQPHLLGFLSFFNDKLQKAKVNLEDKKSALESFIHLIQIMGPKYITDVRLKVIVTLKICQQYEDIGFPELCCRAWSMFVKNVEMNALGPMLSQIIGTLLPLLQQRPRDVAGIFRFLIVESEQNLSKHFQDLFFLPEMPELSDVMATLKINRETPLSQAGLKGLLSSTLPTISHESMEVRVPALGKICEILRNNQKTMYHLIQGSDTMDPLISQFVYTMLHGSRDSNAKAKTLLAECLGELGAIDPGRLEIKSGDEFKASKYHYDIGEDFAVDLINEIARCYFKAESRSQDGSAYAMQELLRIYGCRSESGSFWQRFSAEKQRILRPLLNSKYIVSNPTLYEVSTGPIFHGPRGSTYKDWIFHWMCSLMKMIRHEKTVKIFSSCSVVIKHDIGPTMFLLPYILLYAILGSSDIGQIVEEVLAVVQHDKPDAKSSPSDLHHVCSQTVFSALDYLGEWYQKAIDGECAEGRSADGMKVRGFLDSIPQLDLAKVSTKCEAYARSLRHLEMHVKKSPDDLQGKLNFFQQLYISLDEPDGVAGVTALRQAQPTLHDQILTLESLGKLQDALSCYEIITHLEPNEVDHRKGLLRCLMELDQPDKALNYCNGILEKKPEWSKSLNDYLVEATWKLSSWDELHTYLKDFNGASWGNGVGHLLHAVNSKDSATFKTKLDSIRCEYMGLLSTACMESDSYQRGYKHLTKLHMLSELEKGVRALSLLEDLDRANYSSRLDPMQLVSEWEARLQFVQPSLRSLAPILNLQSGVLEIAKTLRPELSPLIEPEIGRCWLKSAILARKNGHLQRAYSSQLVASRFHLPEVFLETAKWLWQKGDHGQAISTLQNGIKQFYPGSGAQLKFSDAEDGRRQRLQCAKSYLYLARYCEESCNLESQLIVQMYEEVPRIHHDWEEGNFYCAKYYDRLHGMKSSDDMSGALIVHIVKYFGNSLQFGCKYLYQSMPRMLSLWLEFGSWVMALRQQKRSAGLSQKIEEAEQYLKKINCEIGEFLKGKIPLCLFLTAFPQLISRICHTHPTVIALLQEMITQLLVQFPQQSMWMMMAVSKSPHTLRATRCQEIFRKAEGHKPDLQKFIRDATKLTDKLLELCNYNAPDSVMRMNTHFRNLPRLFRDSSFGPILLPMQSSMSITLPSGGGGYTNHEPFPFTPIHIQGFEDLIEVMPSLQKPKKITLIGSDGKHYTMMCKPKDDLRKDSRLMDFNTVVNRFLRHDPESRRRQLHIRTYSVIPLNQECGLIEWVPNLTGLRVILTRLYKSKKIFVTPRELQTYKLANSAPIEQKLKVFKKLIELHPPVFNEWFVTTFPNPTAWYQARLSYSRTLAVMSMVGYILGLGDRHGENILLDSSCGDVVHVDFNCLFNKGEKFECPERVPFRLTHNMVEAMGPLGYEGVYRKCCEATLRVMRDQSDALMSLLKPFIHDPLLEWSRPRSSRGVELGDTPTNEQAMIHVQDIISRLKGIVKGKLNQAKQDVSPLSIEGQVNYLIQDAVDDKNLCQMYIGWAPYM